MAVAAALALTACTGSVDPDAQFGGVDQPLGDDTATALQALLDEAVALSGSSGGLAAVSAPWAGEWAGVNGTVGFEEGDPKVSETTAFRLGWASSEVTCLVLLRLVDSGVVALDDEVSEYVDDIPGLEGITLEQLCRQTSGLPDYYPGLTRHFVSNPARGWPSGELIASGLASARVGPPGEVWSPSRTGVLLLATALGRAAHRDFDGLAHDLVYGPLGLVSTDIPPSSDLDWTGALDAYVAGTAGDGSPDCAVRIDVSAQSSSIGGAAGGIRTTLADAERLSEAFATAALLSEATAKAQWTTTPTTPDAADWVSQGVGGLQYGPMRGLSGEAPGSLAAVYTDPESGLTVVLALNNATTGEAFVREAGFALASIGSKAAAAAGQQQPLVELPWSVDQARLRMAELSKCPIVPAAPPAEEAPPPAG